MLKNLAVVVFMAGGLALAIAFGQTPGAPPDPQTMVQMRVSFLATELSLTDSQKTEAAAIFTSALAAGRSLQSNLQANRQSTIDAVKKNDSQPIDELSAAAGVLSGQLAAIEHKAEAAFYATLNADQQATYDSLPRGPGGPGGPSGPGAMGRPRRPQGQ